MAEASAVAGPVTDPPEGRSLSPSPTPATQPPFPSWSVPYFRLYVNFCCLKPLSWGRGDLFLLYPDSATHSTARCTSPLEVPHTPRKHLAPKLVSHTVVLVRNAGASALSLSASPRLTCHRLVFSMSPGPSSAVFSPTWPRGAGSPSPPSCSFPNFPPLSAARTHRVSHLLVPVPAALHLEHPPCFQAIR